MKNICALKHIVGIDVYETFDLIVFCAHFGGFIENFAHPDVEFSAIEVSQKELVTGFTAEHWDGGWGRTEDATFREIALKRSRGLGDVHRVIFGIGIVFPFEFEHDHGGEGGIGERASDLEFLRGKGHKIAFGDALDGGMFWA